MLNKFISLPILCLTGLGFSAPANADTALVSLKNNPFSRPQLKPEEVSPKQQVVRRPVPQKPASIFIEATLVSENGSMVIANGELIAIGDRLEGMKLVEVREGVAVFRQGRKTRTFKIGVMAEK